MTVKDLLHFLLATTCIDAVHVAGFAQPTVFWSTYYGGNFSDRGNSCAVDNSENVFVAGYTASSNSSSMSTVGAYQVQNMGSSDAFLAKFDPAGTRIWGTFFGGPGEDEAFAVKVADDGSVYIAGLTKSGSGISTPGAHAVNYGGGNGDGFIAKFNGDGVLQWATYYGGASFDKITCLAIMPNSDVVIGGWTQSSSGIATPGAHQEALLGQDSFAARFTPDGARVWGSYFGGIGGFGQEEARSIAADSFGSICLAGYTEATQGISTVGAYQEVFGGSSGLDGDGYLAKFNSSGVLEWATYYGGELDDFVDAVSVSDDGRIAISGRTTSESSIASSGAFQSELTFSSTGEGDAFAALFSSVGTREWGTYLGGSGLDMSTGCGFLGLGGIVFVGYSSSDNLDTPDAIYPWCNGTCGFICSFSLTGQQYWYTYWERQNACAISSQGRIVTCGRTWGTEPLFLVSASQSVIGGLEDAIVSVVNAQTTDINESLPISRSITNAYIVTSATLNQYLNVQGYDLFDSMGHLVCSYNTKSPSSNVHISPGLYYLRKYTLASEATNRLLLVE